MPQPATHRSRCRHPFAGWRGATWLIVAGLLLRSGVPMLAVAAAQLRGIGVAEVCPVYGVQTLAVPAGAAMTMAMAAPHHRSEPAAALQHSRHHDHDHHQHSAADHDHCVLTPLLGAAAFAAADGLRPHGATGDARREPARVASVLPRDAALAWYALGAHPPPRS